MAPQAVPLLIPSWSELNAKLHCAGPGQASVLALAMIPHRLERNPAELLALSPSPLVAKSHAFGCCGISTFLPRTLYGVCRCHHRPNLMTHLGPFDVSLTKPHVVMLYAFEPQFHCDTDRCLRDLELLTLFAQSPFPLQPFPFSPSLVPFGKPRCSCAGHLRSTFAAREGDLPWRATAVGILG